MPKKMSLYNTDRSGIQIEWTPSTNKLEFYAWYDSHVGIEGGSMPLSEFFMKMGITRKDADKAFLEIEEIEKGNG